MKERIQKSALPLGLAWACLGALLLAGCVNSHDSDSGNPSAQGPGAAGDEGTDSSRHAINGSIHVNAGAPGGDATTVNGSIRADDNAHIDGGHTVNGNISLGNHATATSLTTVNGGISLGDGAHVTQTVTTVNGTLDLRPGAQVDGRLANVNGTIRLDGATVGGGIATVNGNIDIGANSHVRGGIVVHKPSTGFFHWWSDSDKPRVVVGPGAVVEGTLQFNRAVHLYVSDTATIGPVSGATVVKFSGDHPPT